MQYNDNCAREDSRRPHARDGSAEDESDGVWCRTTDSGADLEDDDSDDKYPFRREQCIDFAEDELGGAVGDEIDTSVPTDVVEGFEVVGDPWDGGCNDCSILV